MEIKIGLDTNSIQSAIAQLDKISGDLQTKIDKFLQQLASVGAEAVKRKFAESNHESDDGYDIGYRQEGGGYTIYADGQQVAFIEFGTGSGAWYPTDVGVTIHPGSWSATEGTGEYAKYGSWHWHKKKYYGSNPAFGFVEARAEIEYQAPKIAKEIFG